MACCIIIKKIAKKSAPYLLTVSIPYIFHSTNFIQAPVFSNSYIHLSLESQKKYFCLPKWQHLHWNENTFLSICENPLWHVPQAQKLIDIKAWAIISDFLRLYALYTHGGVYADWDVQFLCDISQKSFYHTDISPHIILGFEPYTYKGRNNIQIGIQLAISSAGHTFWKNLYNFSAQCLWSTQFDILPGILTSYLETNYNLVRYRNQHAYYHLKDGIVIYPVDVFYPCRGTADYNKNKITDYTLSIHWEHSQQKHPHIFSWPHYLHQLKK